MKTYYFCTILDLVGEMECQLQVHNEGLVSVIGQLPHFAFKSCIEYFAELVGEISLDEPHNYRITDIQTICKLIILSALVLPVYDEIFFTNLVYLVKLMDVEDLSYWLSRLKAGDLESLALLQNLVKVGV